MTPWISRVAVWVSWTFMLFCALEILQVGSLNLALFTWFSWAWYIPKSASCTLQLFKSRKWEFFWHGQGNLSPPSGGTGFFTFPLALDKARQQWGFLLPSNVLFWCLAHCCSSPSAGTNTHLIHGDCSPRGTRTGQTRDSSSCTDDSALLLPKVPVSLSNQWAKTSNSMQGESVMIKPAHTCSNSVFMGGRNAS